MRETDGRQRVRQLEHCRSADQQVFRDISVCELQSRSYFHVTKIDVFETY